MGGALLDRPGNVGVLSKEALGYNAEADKDSWERMLKFLAEVFGKK